MNNAAIKEMLALLKSTFESLSAGLPYSADNGAELTQKLNETLANGYALISNRTIGTALNACFEAAFLTNISVPAIRQIKTALQAQIVVSTPAITMKLILYSLLLSLECKCLAKITFSSRKEIDGHLAVMNKAFDEIEEAACDQNLSALFVAMSKLRGATMRDLTERSKPLPRLSTLKLAKSLPSLVLAYNLYDDISKADSLVQENRVSNPAFMPRTISALVN